MNPIPMRIFRVALLVTLAASPLAAQRGGRRAQQPQDTTPAAAKKIDTSLVRKTPDGFVLDFQ